VEAVAESQETISNYDEELEEESESLSPSVSIVGDPGSDCTLSILAYINPNDKTIEMLVLQSTKKSNDKTDIKSHNDMKQNIRAPLKPKASTDASQVLSPHKIQLNMKN